MEKKPEVRQKRLAAIRVRGLTMVNSKIQDTMKMLRLYKNNFCIVLPNTPVYTGMLKKAKDYITWGEIDDETFKTLVEKRGEQFSGRESDSKNKIKYNDFIVIDRKSTRLNSSHSSISYAVF